MSTPEDSQPTNEQLQTQLLELSQRLEHRDLLVAELQAVNAKLHEQLTTAAEQIALLKKALFGRRSERFTQSPNQPLLFPIEPIAGDEQSPSAPAEATSPPEPEVGASPSPSSQTQAVRVPTIPGRDADRASPATRPIGLSLRCAATAW